MPLAEVTVCVYDFNNFDFEERIPNFFGKMTDIFVNVSNSVIIGSSWNATWLVVLIPCMEASLITMVASDPSQSDVGDMKLEYYSNRFIRSSSLVGSHADSLLSVSFSYVVMGSIISFMMASGDFKSFVGCLSSFSN